MMNSVLNASKAVRTRSIVVGLLAGLVLSGSGAIPSAMAVTKTAEAGRIDSLASSADGRWMVWQQREKTSTSLWVLDLQADTPAPRSLLSATNHHAHDPVFSGDGKWVYFVSDMSGADQLWRIDPSEGIPERLTR